VDNAQLTSLTAASFSHVGGAVYGTLVVRQFRLLETTIRGFCQKCERIGGVRGAAASSMKARSLVVLKPHVKGNCVGRVPDLLVTISLGGSVNTREKVAVLRLKTFP